MNTKKLNLTCIENGKNISFSTLSQNEMNQIAGGQEGCTKTVIKGCCYNTSNNMTGDKSTTTTTNPNICGRKKDKMVEYEAMTSAVDYVFGF